MKYLCCCKRETSWYRARKKKFEAQEEAYRRVNNEIDLLNIMTLLRQSNFMSLITMKEHQRQLISCFNQYNVDLDKVDASQDNPVINGAYYLQNSGTAELESFDPDTDATDRLLLN